MKVFKVLGVLAALLVVLAAAGLFGVVYYIDSIAKRAIERGATHALGVKTTVSGADIGLTDGTFKMTDLEVDNPEGFKDHFLKIGDGGVAVEYSSLRQDVVMLPHLRLTDIDVSLEKKGGKSNYRVILDHLRAVQGKDQAPTEPPKDPRRYTIEELTIKSVLVHVDLVEVPGAISGVLDGAVKGATGGQSTGQIAKVNIPIEEIKLTGVGKTGTGVKGTGVTMEELAGIIVQAVLGAAMDKGGGVIPGEILSDLQAGLGGLDGLKDIPVKVVGEVAKQAEEALKGVTDQVGKEAEKAVKDIGDKIGDVLGGGREKKKPAETPK